MNPNDDGDIDTGANFRLNFPVIIIGDEVRRRPAAGRANATVELFMTKGAVGQNGPARTYVGTTTSDASGNWTLPVDLRKGDVVTATATDMLGDTSELGTNVKVK